MKRVGLIGGLSWVSTRLYYDAINRAVAARLGGAHSASLLIDSLDFAPVTQAQAEGRWHDAGAAIADSARRLTAAGADALAIASNTMHKCADAVTAASPLPLIHIVDALGDALLADGRSSPLLLGTRFTMEQDFVRAPLDAMGLRTLIPAADARATVDRIIHDELIKGIVREDSRDAYLAIIRDGAAAGADCVILGCTEIGMLVDAENAPLPPYDTMAIHSHAIVDFMLGG